MKRAIRINLDGSCELYEALCTIAHARNFLGNKPGVFLMTMLPLFGKSGYEIAFVYPKFDGTHKEREQRMRLSRETDGLTARHSLTTMAWSSM